MDLLFSVQEVAEWIRSFGWLAVAVSLSLSVMVSVVGIIPPVFLSTTNAVVYGLGPGFLISLCGETIGAAVTYLVYRSLINKVEQVGLAQRFTFIKPSQWKWIQMLQAAKRGRRALLLLIAFMTPFLPSSLVTFAAAASRARYLDFVLLAFIGKAPSIALETFIGHDLVFLSDNWGRLIIAVTMLVVLILILRRTTRFC